MAGPTVAELRMEIRQLIEALKQERAQVAALTAERDEARQHAEKAEADALADRLAMVSIRAQRDAATQRAEAAVARAAKAEAILHDAVATPLAEWATTLAAANENVAGTAALLAEEKKAREAAEALAKEWERLYNDRNAAWRSAEEKREAAEAKAEELEAEIANLGERDGRMDALLKLAREVADSDDDDTIGSIKVYYERGEYGCPAAPYHARTLRDAARAAMGEG